MASSHKKANFIWYAPKTSIHENEEECILYEKCDLGEKARYPQRAGITYKRKN